MPKRLLLELLTGALLFGWGFVLGGLFTGPDASPAVNEAEPTAVDSEEPWTREECNRCMELEMRMTGD